MKIEPFVLERWMTAHELSATHDIAESGILPLSARELLSFEPPEKRDATRYDRFHWQPADQRTALQAQPGGGVELLVGIAR